MIFQICIEKTDMSVLINFYGGCFRKLIIQILHLGLNIQLDECRFN